MAFSIVLIVIGSLLLLFGIYCIVYSIFMCQCTLDTIQKHLKSIDDSITKLNETEHDESNFKSYIK